MRALASWTCAIALAGCAGEAPGPTRPGVPGLEVVPTGFEAAGGTELILLGLDGAEWAVIDDLFESDELPHLRALVDGGVRGDLVSERPIQSPPIWTTIATGRTRADHGIESFFVTRDDGRKIPVTTQVRTARPFWDLFTEVGIDVGVVGWWPSWPAEDVGNGFLISDRAWPVRFSPNAVPYGSRRDGAGEVAAWDFERRTWPDSLFDEFERFILTEEAVIRPDVTERIFGTQAEPESEMWNGYWVYAKDHTFARAGLHFLETRRPRVFALYLEGPDVMSHYYWHYRVEEGFDVAPEKRALYGTAVERYYRYCDAVLGGLQQAAGPSAAVVIVSDHGFETFQDLKVRWERGEEIEHEGGKGGYPYHHALEGIFVAGGPGFATGSVVEGASIYDVLPTVLHRMGLPAGEDMPGRVLEGAFAAEFSRDHPVRRIPTWETGTGQVVPLEATPVDDALMEKLRSLGYVE